MKALFASNLIKYFELIAGITGIICYYKRPKTIWFAFALYLIALFCMEFYGAWLGNIRMYVQNTHLYKWIVVPSLFIMYHFVFYAIINNPKKRLVLAGALLFTLIAGLENIFWNAEHFYTISLSISVGCLLILTYTFIYLFQLMKSTDILGFTEQPAFWFCIALLIFYLGCFPYLTFFNSMSIAKNKNIYDLYRWGFIILNYLMYGLFIIAFLCNKQKS